jgi:PAS domain S-box-containing protein
LKNGEIRTFCLSGEIFELDGKPHFLKSCKDITESKRIQDQIRLSEELFSKAFNTSPIPMVIISADDQKYIMVNMAYCHCTGYSYEDTIGHTPLELGFFMKATDYDQAEWLLLTNQSVRDMEIMFRNKKGEQRLGLISTENIVVDGRSCILGILVDITEQRKMEIEMTRLDRLNLVGEMSASIGHEIRNPMTTVRGYLQLLREREDYQPDKDYFDLMIEELDRANSIITEFLSLAKNKMVDMTRQNLNAIISKSLPLIEASALSRNQYIYHELNDLPDLLLDKEEIHQLILNMLKNGLESMSSTGAVTIKTLVENENALLVIEDQGSGIDRAVLDKLGTPFFTTKENGTGLGLAVCYRIAARHNATIDVKTSSKGTAFFIRFPIPQ